MHKNATKCNKTLSKWCKNKHGASKIIDMFERFQRWELIWPEMKGVPAAPWYSRTEARRRRSMPGSTCSAYRGSSPSAKPPRPQRKRPWLSNCLGMGETNGDEGDERRRGRRFPTVRRKRARRRFICPTRRQRKPPELVGIAQRRRRRRAVVRAREGIRVRVRSGKTERGDEPDWARLVWPNLFG
jgi:hypothetical protein